MGTQNIDELMKFMSKNLLFFKEKSVYEGTHNQRIKNIKLPTFELKPRDYLEFAEKELDSSDPRNLINCLSNLKRAMDCQLDIFLFVFNLYGFFDTRNLSIGKKLKFLEACSIFNSRSLTRLNKVRNKMEHEYEIPKIQDIEVYFDLVTAFVIIIEPLISTLYQDKTMFFSLDDDENNRFGDFEITYDYDIPSIGVRGYIDEEGISMKADLNNINEFAYFFKIYLLLYQRNPIISTKYLLKQINNFNDLYK